MNQPASPNRDKGGVAGRLRRVLHSAFLENAGLKFVALVLALTAFVLVHNKENNTYHPSVPLSYTEDNGRVLVSRRVDQVTISVRGTPRRIRRLQNRQLDQIAIDLKERKTGELQFAADMFNLPEGIELISINPPSIYLEFDEKDSKVVPVTVDVLGAPARGFRLGGISTNPQTVRVTGAKKTLASLASVATEKVDLRGRTKDFEGRVGLVLNELEAESDRDVQVSLKIVEDLEARVLADRKVVVRSPEAIASQIGRFTVDPAAVKITMYGAVHALEAVDVDTITVFVELGATDLLGDGVRQVELKVEPKLSDIAYKISPSTVTLKRGR